MGRTLGARGPRPGPEARGQGHESMDQWPAEADEADGADGAVLRQCGWALSTSGHAERGGLGVRAALLDVEALAEDGGAIARDDDTANPAARALGAHVYTRHRGGRWVAAGVDAHHGFGAVE